LESQDRVTQKTIEALKATVTDQATQDKLLDATKAKMLDVIDDIVTKLRTRSPSSAPDSPGTSAAVPTG
jgi:hypothetical protein